MLATGKPGHDRANFRPIVEHRPDVAADEHRLAVGWVDPRQIEEAVVDARLQIAVLGEEAGDEVALLVQPALRGSANIGEGASPNEVDTMALVPP